MKQTEEGRELDLQRKMDHLFGSNPVATPALKTMTPGAFGVVDDTAGYFRVSIGEAVTIEEMIPGHHGELISTPRCLLSMERWQSIAPTIQATLNAQLKVEGQRPGKFLKGGGILNRFHLGKEVLVLAWSVEDLDVSEISTARGAWLALHRVERWWLYNQTVRLNGRADQRGIGWRLALRYALTARTQGAGA